MKIDKNIIKHFKSEREKRIKDASQKLLGEQEGGLEGAKSDLDWIDTSSRLIASTQKNKTIWAIVGGVICVLLVGSAWSVHLFTTQISFEVVTENVNLILSQNWSSDYQFISDKIFINNLLKVNAPGLNPPINIDLKGESVVMDLEGKDIIFNKLILMANAEVELNLQGDNLNFFIKRSPTNGEITIQKANFRLEIGERISERTLDFEIPETINFETVKTVADPVRIEFRSKENWRLRGLQVQTIGFLEEYPFGSGNFESVIQSGQVTVLETGFTEDLRESDCLTLKKVRSRRLEISRVDKGIKVFFEGSVKEIRMGPKNFQKNLTPTWLEYLYHQQRLAFFCSAVGFLWTMLWSIRNTIFK